MVTVIMPVTSTWTRMPSMLVSMFSICGPMTANTMPVPPPGSMTVERPKPSHLPRSRASRRRCSHVSARETASAFSRHVG